MTCNRLTTATSTAACPPYREYRQLPLPYSTGIGGGVVVVVVVRRKTQHTHRCCKQGFVCVFAFAKQSVRAFVDSCERWFGAA